MDDGGVGVWLMGKRGCRSCGRGVWMIGERGCG